MSKVALDVKVKMEARSGIERLGATQDLLQSLGFDSSQLTIGEAVHILHRIEDVLTEVIESDTVIGSKLMA